MWTRVSIGWLLDGTRCLHSLLVIQSDSTGAAALGLSEQWCSSSSSSSNSSALLIKCTVRNHRGIRPVLSALFAFLCIVCFLESLTLFRFQADKAFLLVVCFSLSLSSSKLLHFLIVLKRCIKIVLLLRPLPLRADHFLSFQASSSRSFFPYSSVFPSRSLH